MIATAPISVTLPARPLRVVPVAGEPTRFHVESVSLACSECNRLFSRLKCPGMADGDACPKCDNGVLRERWHMVDIAMNNCSGECSCEYFSFTLGPKVRALPADQQRLGRNRCSHIEAARNAALDITLRAHQEMRGGQ